MSDARMQTQLIIPDPAAPRLVETVRLAPRELLCTSCWYAIERERSSSCSACGSSLPASGWPSIPYSFRNRYVFVGQVECNAVAAVFRACSIGTSGGPEILVKVARGDGTPESLDIAKKAFRREVTVAGLLSDESNAFVGVRGSDTEDPAYIALEYVPWPTLNVLFSQLGILSSADVARMGIALLRGVASLEKRRIVHGHLFPKNIHASRRADDGFDIKIAGAGAEPPKPDDPAVGLQRPQAYMSPEQLAGDALGTESDIHTVASVLWELATGQVPWPLPDHGLSSAQRLSVLRKAPKKPDAMPGELYEILARALSFDPSARACPGGRSARPREDSLAAGMEQALQKFLSESSRQQASTRQKLEAISQTLGQAREGLAPFSALMDSAGEIEATLRRLRDGGDESGVSAQVEAAERSARELILAIEARRGLSGLGSDNHARLSKFSAPEARAPEGIVESRAPSVPTAASGSSSYILLAVGSAIAGLLIGFLVGRAGAERQSLAGEPTAGPSATPIRSGDPGQRSTPASASLGLKPEAPAPATATPQTTRTSTFESTPSPTAPPPGTEPEPAGPAPAPTPRLTGRLPQADPYGDAKAAPKPPAKPASKPGDDPY